MLMPYLSYQGDCENAFNFYASVFGGKIEWISRFNEETGGSNLAGKVMHAQLSFTGNKGYLNGADQEESVVRGEAIKLIYHCGSETEAQRIFDILAKEGHEVSRLAPHPPPDDNGVGGVVVDKYGYTWILAAPRDNL